ncbi:SemiSWEET transporter [Actinoplanes sp. NPDC051494]|uniref:SemiSWEET transporter n=1 Tax=Actinoplanes sp. NPDC051494 TaxID=3363907 RepID=UPI0037A46ABF
MHSFAILGWIGAALSIALPWPQVWRSCAKGQTNGLNASACFLGVAMPVGWITYGALTGETVQIITNLVTGGAALAVLTTVLIKQRDLRQRRRLLTSTAGAAGIVTTAAAGAVATLLTTFTNTQVASVLGGVLAVTSIISAVPQPLSLLRDRTQDMAGLSPLRWRLAAAACACWMTYGFATAQPAVWLSAVVGLTSALIVCWVLYSAGRAKSAAATTTAIVTPAVTQTVIMSTVAAGRAAGRPGGRGVARAAACGIAGRSTPDLQYQLPPNGQGRTSVPAAQTAHDGRFATLG